MAKLINFKEKLNDVIFIDLKSNAVKSIFGFKLDGTVSFPIRAFRIVKQVKENNDVDEISIAYILEGMLYVIGADDKFIYNKKYIEILKSSEKNLNIAKGIIANEIRNSNLEDAVLILKGLCTVQANEENYKKLIMLIHEIGYKKKEYRSEELKFIEEAKTICPFNEINLYEALIKREQGDFEIALHSLNTYISKTGTETEEISNLKTELATINNYEKGKEIKYNDPEGALKLLLPLINSMKGEASLFYHIGVAYRCLQNHEKAIYYLNEGLELDKELVEIYNELGVNYACLNEHLKAIAYLRKAFEATKSVEICTNLILCYYYAGDFEQAKIHLSIAEKIKPDDEIVHDLKLMLK